MAVELKWCTVSEDAGRSPSVTRSGGSASRRSAKLLVNIGLALAAVMGLIMGVSVGLPSWLGLKGMVVISGSMEPTIMTGDVALIKVLPADAVKVGDVVTFRTVNGPGMTTHRVIAEKDVQGHRYLQTKGDANDSPDANLVPAEAVYGKVNGVEPKVGYLLQFAGTPMGKMSLIIIPIFLVLGSELVDLRKILTGAKEAAPAAIRPLAEVSTS